MFFKFWLLSLCLLALHYAVQVKASEDDNSHDKYVAEDIRRLLKMNLKHVDRLIPEEEKDPEFWRNVGRQQLEENLKKQKLNTNKAKNIIFFLGDGMGLSTVAAARTLQGQRKGKRGEEEQFSFEKFPHTALSKTYCTNAQVPDSACSATAYLCGVKGNILTIGVNANVHMNNCTESMDPKNHVSSIAAWAQKAGKSTGFITTTTLTHASPSGLYAHVANRLHESDADVRSFDNDPKKCMDIATQLVTQEPGRNFDILMGGGMSKFLPKYTEDIHGNFGVREDGEDLLCKWQSLHPEGVIVTNRDELLNVNVSKVSKIMGVFKSKYMDYHLKADAAKQPTLAEMTEKAINLMKTKPNGYFLFVEGGLIDTAHHATKAALALDETIEFAKAVELARNLTNPEDTLILTTADHSHPLTIAGYPGRGTDILGLNSMVDANFQKYLTLNYPLGPKQYLDEQGQRLNLDKIKRDADFEYPGYIKARDGRHAGEDVGIYASGPFSHLFTGVIEESTIPYILAYAACLGDGHTMCDENLCKENWKSKKTSRRGRKQH